MCQYCSVSCSILGYESIFKSTSCPAPPLHPAAAQVLAIPAFVGSTGSVRIWIRRSFEFLLLFVPDSLLKIVFYQRNLFASSFLAINDLPPKSHATSLDDVIELKKLIAFLVELGLVGIYWNEEYWGIWWPFA